jgi:hypothetical protein
VGLFKVCFRKPELSLSTVWSIHPVIVPLLEGEFGYCMFYIIKRDRNKRRGTYYPLMSASFGQGVSLLISLIAHMVPNPG